MKTLKYAWRFLMRSKSYTIINLLGLAFSLACSIILMRYIPYRNDDMFRIYAMCIHRQFPMDISHQDDAACQTDVTAARQCGI